MADTFFDDRQGAAVLKHGALRRYLPPFTLKVASVTSDGLVYYLDTHAGPGAYDSGVPGSPSFAALTAERIATFKTNARLRCLYVEKDRELFARLEDRVGAVAHDHRCFEGLIEDHLDTVMKEVGDAPLFIFLDPFGLAVPFSMLMKLLRRTRREGATIISPITEMLMNFSLPGLRRNAGKVFGKGKDSYALGRHMDDVFAGDWWREIWRSDASDREMQIFREYRRKLAVASGYEYVISGPVSDRWEGSPSYYLVYMTRNKQGVGLFADSVALATEEFYQFTHQGQLDLEPRAEREAQWAPIMVDNVRRLLAENDGAFNVGSKIPAVYGDTLGYAGQPQLRAVLKGMCKTGEFTTYPESNAKGDVYKLRIKAGPGS